MYHFRGHPHQSRFARQLPPGRGKPLWDTQCAPLRHSTVAGRPHPPRCARHLPLKGKAFGPPRAAAPTDYIINGPSAHLCRAGACPRRLFVFAILPHGGGKPPPYDIALIVRYAYRAALQFISPSVICFANATSLVRGRLFCRFHPPIYPENSPHRGTFSYIYWKSGGTAPFS